MNKIEELINTYDPQVIIDAASQIHLSNLIEKGDALVSPADTNKYLQNFLAGQTREMFVVLFLDTRHRVIKAETLFQGSIDGACVYPRVVVEQALLCNAAAVILAHNHPSGLNDPSLSDQAITRRIKEALSLVEIRLLDHIIISNGVTPLSMASKGLI